MDLTKSKESSARPQDLIDPEELRKASDSFNPEAHGR
jgi:hypothetical protein